MTATTGDGAGVRTVGVPWRVSRDEAVDLAGAVLLSSLAVVGFGTVFNGPNYLVASLPAAAAAGVVGCVAARMRLGAVVAAAAAVVGYFLVGAPFAMRSLAPSAFADLMDGTVNGWARLLTTLPPAGQEGNLLAPPFFCAYAAAFSSMVLARRLGRWHACVLPPLAALAVGVLFGLDRPASLLLQGAVFAVATIGWMSLRDARRRGVVVHTTRARRRVGPVVLLGAAGAGAFLVGPGLPLAESRPRYVLREEVKPPFDPRTYPSPLVAFRTFRTETAKETTYLTAAGLPEGARIRMAVLDDYDGTVWRATGAGGMAAGTYDRVGEVIPQDVEGSKARIDLGVEALKGVWVPAIGQPTAVGFGGPRGADLLDALRFNRQADVGAVPGIDLASGDRVVLDSILLPDPTPRELASAAADPRAVVPEPAGLDESLRSLAAERTATASGPFDRATALASWLREGFYSDGGPGTDVPPGHSLGRIALLLDPDRQMVGNAEQYAAAMGVMARSVGLPARVVLGFRPDDHGTREVAITGADATAWVEVAFAGHGWVPFDPTPDESRTPQPSGASKPTPLPAESQPPPPTTAPSLDDALDQQRAQGGQGPPNDDGASGFPLASVLRAAAAVSLPLLVVAAPFAAIAGIKARRRRRRRSSGAPATRISGGWAELVDQARDLGSPVPAKITRREAARLLEGGGLPGVTHLAGDADAAVFGRETPGPETAAAFWAGVDATIEAARAPLGRVDRLRASVSLASLRPAR